MNGLRVFIPSMLCALALGCGESGVPVLQQRLSALEAEVATLKASVKKRELQDSIDEFTKDLDAIAYLTPGDEGYSVIQTEIGRFTVQLVDVRPFANGSRVTLKFGNPLSATIGDVSAIVEWGRMGQKGHPDNESARSRTFSFKDSLPGGSWKTVEVVLEGIPAQELGFVRVKELKHRSMILRTR